MPLQTKIVSGGVVVLAFAAIATLGKRGTDLRGKEASATHQRTWDGIDESSSVWEDDLFSRRAGRDPIRLPVFSEAMQPEEVAEQLLAIRRRLNRRSKDAGVPTPAGMESDTTAVKANQAREQMLRARFEQLAQFDSRNVRSSVEVSPEKVPAKGPSNLATDLPRYVPTTMADLSFPTSASRGENTTKKRSIDTSSDQLR